MGIVMKKEDIEIAACRYQGELIGSVINNTNVDCYEENYEAGRMHALSDYTEKIFIDGAKWRINSVWHDIKEMPENNRMILIIMQHDIPTVLGPDNT